MKISIVTVAFNEEMWISKCVKQFEGYGFNHVVLVSAKSWNGNQVQTDNTADIAKKMGASVYVEGWSSETEQRNFGQDMCKDSDWVLIVDADEFMEKRSINNALEYLKTAQDVLYRPQETRVYWKDYNLLVDKDGGPADRGGHNFAIRPDVRFTDKRDAGIPYQGIPGVRVHHMSYVRSDADMLKKITTFSHSDELKTNWYEEKWLGWHEELTDLHPVSPTQYHKAIKCTLPSEISNLCIQ